MNTKSLLAITLTALTLIPAACTIESSSDKDNGGSNSGGADEKGGSTSNGGSAGKAGSTSSGGKSNTGGSTTAGSSAAGSSTLAGAAGNSAGSAGVAGTATTAGTAGGGASSTTGAGGTSSTAGASNLAGAAGTTAVAQTRLDVTDDVHTPTTWTADHVYVIPSGTTVYVDTTLTIQPGTVVKFGAGARLYIEADGQLNAVGTSGAPIVFTGIKDDTAGGDTNGDGSASKASLGDWSALNVYGNASAFDYVQLRYADDGLTLHGASQSVKHSTFTSNGTGLDATRVVQPANTVITDNVFYKNTVPVAIDGATPLNATNVFHNPAEATEINTFQGIVVRDTPVTSVTWSNTEVAYVLPNSNASYYVESPAALTLAAGVVVKVGTGSTIIVESGASLVGASSATFTSYRDDSKLGDSNGDGSATSPAADDWNGVRVITSTDDTWLTGTNILYAAN